MASSRVRQAQRTVLAEAVLDLGFAFECSFMTGPAVPINPIAVIKSNGAAIHTFPVDILGSVTSRANVRANAHLLDEARPTKQILPPSLDLPVHLLLTVDKPAIVRFIAPRAHIKTDFGLGERHQVIIILVTRSGETGILVQVLLFDDLHGLDLDLTPQDVQFLDLITNLLVVLNINWLLAGGTTHEGKRDP